MKCITLEYPDGTVATRGGFGAVFLASWVQKIVEDSDERPTLTAKQAEEVLRTTSAQIVERARDLALQWVVKNRVPSENPGATARVEDLVFPDDKYFRLAWVRRSGVMGVDMPRAREIEKGRVRAARNGRLKVLDGTTTGLREQVELGKKSQAELDAHLAEKQRLRDLPNGPAGTDAQFDQAPTPEALRALWPNEFDRRG